MPATVTSRDGQERLDVSSITVQNSENNPSTEEHKARYVLQMAKMNNCLSDDYHTWLYEICALWCSGLFSVENLLHMSDGRRDNHYLIRKTSQKFPDPDVKPTRAFGVAKDVLGQTFIDYLKGATKEQRK